jgi:hypothetical protein
MLLNKQSVFHFLLGILFVMNVNGVELHLSCNDDQAVDAISIKENENSQKICDDLKKINLNCLDTKKGNSLKNKVSLQSPINSYYSNRNSNQYDREEIQSLIQDALVAGVDPYLALAIDIVENPAVHDNSRKYANMYGRPPIDAVAFVEEIGCKTVLSNKNTYKITNFNSSKLIKFPPPEKNSKLCFYNNEFFVGESPTILFSDSKENCCFKIEHPKNWDFPKIERETKNLLALSFLKRKIEAFKKKAKNADLTFSQKASRVIQGYNGYGTIGASENLKNKCISGLKMKETPLYGAGVADIMVNFLMMNSEINEMIKSSKKQLGIKKQRSLFCELGNKKKLILDPLEFAQLQKGYLKEKKNCPEISYNYKNLNEELTKKSEKNSTK